jgi:hypothetical protein
MITKCICKGCTATCAVEGDWLCSRCFVTISTGVIGSNNHTFIGDLRDELLIAAAMAESLSVISALVINGSNGVSDQTTGE